MLIFCLMNMILLPQSTTAQLISFIPRVFEAHTVTVTNEQSKDVQTFTPEFYTNDYYLSCYLVLVLLENQFYQFEVKNINGITIYLDKLLCQTTT